MSADVRGFNYALEPLRKRQAWQLEALQARLGIANRDIASATSQLHQRHERLREQHAKACEAVTQRVDPVLQRRSLCWLAQLREEITLAQTRMNELQMQRSHLMTECVASQNKLAAIERHRDECLAEYAQTHQNRLAAAADSDWLARRHRVEAGNPARGMGAAQVGEI
jgi:predicted  nucleic acid-binding Zn-ribbon protein